MDSATTTDDLVPENKQSQENILLEIVKQISSDTTKISFKLCGKLNRIIADCDLTHHSGLHKLSTADQSTSTVLGMMNQINSDLTYDEQVEVNQAIIKTIQDTIPKYIAELNKLSGTNVALTKSRSEQINDLQKSLDDKLKTLEEQETQKVELMMEWLNYRLSDVGRYSNHSSELLSLKTKILDVKSKILHLQILQNIFTETNQSIQSYKEIHKDLKESIKDSENRIKQFREVIASDDI